MLPRSTGLRLCTATLNDSVEYIYDLTIGYSGVQGSDIPGKVYTIPNIFFFNYYPKQIHIYVRRFKIADVPFRNEKLFSEWNLARWVEKDNYLADFYEKGSFSSDNNNTTEVPVQFQGSYFDLLKPWLILMTPFFIYYTLI